MKQREDKSVLYEPRCPFCKEIFNRPIEIDTELGSFLGGVCNCGAVYSFDPTGRNLGETFMDALSYACGQNWDLAMSLEPGADYEEMIINYDIRTHTVSPKKSGFYGFTRNKGRLFFVKLRGKYIKAVD